MAPRFTSPYTLVSDAPSDETHPMIALQPYSLIETLAFALILWTASVCRLRESIQLMIIHEGKVVGGYKDASPFH